MHRLERRQSLHVQRIQIVLTRQLGPHALLDSCAMPRRLQGREVGRVSWVTHDLEAFDTEITEQLSEHLGV